MMYLSGVKRFAGILFIAIHLFTFAEFQNLLKLPALIEHFREYKKVNADMDFWSFIKLHYFEPLTFDHDYERDRQLPFQSTDTLPITSVNLFECQPITLELAPVKEVSHHFYQFNDNKKQQFTSFDIFQPPRCA
ncbi:MAG: hypothetical protein WBC06_00800 [Chitinophagaceae bacterium]